MLNFLPTVVKGLIEQMDYNTENEEVIVDWCEECGKPIYRGDYMFDYKGVRLCEECRNDYTFETSDYKAYGEV